MRKSEGMVCSNVLDSAKDPQGGVTGSGPALGEGDITRRVFLSDKCKRRVSDPGTCWNEEGEKEKWFWRRRSGVFKVREAG